MPAHQEQASVSADANGQHFVFRISVDGVPLPDGPNELPKPKTATTDCDFTS